MQNASNSGMFKINFLDGSVWWSDDLFRCFNLVPGQITLTYDSFFEYIHEDDIDLVREAIEQLRQSESAEPAEIEYRSLNKNGDELHILALFVPEKNSNGQTTSCLGVCQNISERKQNEDKLQLLSRAMESSSAAIFITNLEGDIEYTNPKFTEINGYTQKEIMGQNSRILKSGKTPITVYEELWATITAGGEWKGELYNRNKNGSYSWHRISISSIKNHDGKITHYIGMQDDVTREYELSERLHYQATHDALTGLCNRHEFERRTRHMLSTIQIEKAVHSMCFLDLDQFKVINDTYGHTGGDELLRQLGQVLQGAIRQHDTVARLGGDEFGILLEYCSITNARRIAKSIQTVVLEHTFIWQEQPLKVAVSIGLAAATENTNSLEELLRQADSACYAAKKLGHGRIYVYRPENER